MAAKQKKTLIILVAVLAVLAAAFAAVRLINASAERRNAKEAEEAVIHMGDTLGEITELTFGRPGEENRFVLINGLWKLASDEEFPLDSTKVAVVASTLRRLTAVRDIGMENALADYGLEPPQYTVFAVDAGGKEYALDLGNTYTIGGEQLCYAMEQGGSTIYSIKTGLSTYVSASLMSMIAKDDFTGLNEERVTDVTVSGGDKTLILTKTSAPDLSTGKTAYTWYVDGMPASEYVSAGGEKASVYVPKLVDNLTSFYFSSCAAYRPSQDEMKAFGLADPVTAAFGLEDEDTGETSSVTLLIGAPAPDDSGYYAKLPDSDQVCIISSACAEAVLTALEALGQ